MHLHGVHLVHKALPIVKCTHYANLFPSSFREHSLVRFIGYSEIWPRSEYQCQFPNRCIPSPNTKEIVRIQSKSLAFCTRLALALRPKSIQNHPHALLPAKIGMQPPTKPQLPWLQITIREIHHAHADPDPGTEPPRIPEVDHERDRRSHVLPPCPSS
jgi:hypothetical protein